MKSFCIGIIVGIAALAAWEFIHPVEHHDGYEKGDRVKITEQCVEGNCFYRNCNKLTYLSGTVLNRNSSDKPIGVAWILAEECKWYQYPDIGMVTDQAVVTLKMKEFEKY